MAKQKDKKEQQTIEPVTNYDHLEKSERILSVHDIEKMIVTLRGVQVMIDRDLAFLYQVEVKQMNRQVKRNIERFPEDFMFQLTKEEYASLKCHFGTSNERGGDRRALPYAFTQQGIGMLSGLLRSKIEENSPKMLPEQIFPTGCVWDAWAYVSDLVRGAKSRIILIDNFVDDRVLSLFTKRAEGVSATIHSRYTKQFLTDLEKHNEQYPTMEFVQLPHRNHDRFLIIDDKVHFLGASLKDMGAGLCAVTEMTTTPENILALLK